MPEGIMANYMAFLLNANPLDRSQLQASGLVDQQLRLWTMYKTNQLIPKDTKSTKKLMKPRAIGGIVQRESVSKKATSDKNLKNEKIKDQSK